MQADAEISGSKRTRARRKLSPLTIILTVLVALISVGAMVGTYLAMSNTVNFSTLWGSLWGQAVAEKKPEVPHSSPYITGLKVEKAGPPQVQQLVNPEQTAIARYTAVARVTPNPSASVTAAPVQEEPVRASFSVKVPVIVRNEVQMPAASQGTAVPGQPTAVPVPGPTNIYHASIKVIFYNHPDGDLQKLDIVGGGNGTVENLKYGESRQIEIVATSVGEFCEGCYEVYPDTMWTDKDPVPATQSEGGEGKGEGATTPNTTPNPSPAP